MHAKFETNSKICFQLYDAHSATNSTEFEILNKSKKNLQVNYSKLYTLHNEWFIPSESTNLYKVACASAKNSSIILRSYFKLLDRFGLVL